MYVTFDDMRKYIIPFHLQGVSLIIVNVYFEIMLVCVYFIFIQNIFQVNSITPKSIFYFNYTMTLRRVTTDINIFLIICFKSVKPRLKFNK